MRLLGFPFPKPTQSESISLWQKQPRNPTSDDIPPVKNALWINTETGEIFVHMKTCSHGAIWKGQFGTLIAPATIAKFDIFEDGSAVALYRFDGNVNDDGGLYDFGTTETQQFVDGKWHQAIWVTNSQQLKVDNFPNFEAITFSMWLKVDGHIGGWRNIFHLTPDGQNLSGNSRQPAVFLHQNDNSKFHFRNDGVNSSNLGIEATQGKITYGEWNHVVFIRTLNTLKVYINGQLTDTYTASEDFKHNAGTLYIGDPWYGHDFGVDQLRIFNRALTEAEIQILYKEMEEC